MSLPTLPFFVVCIDPIMSLQRCGPPEVELGTFAHIWRTGDERLGFWVSASAKMLREQLGTKHLIVHSVVNCDQLYVADNVRIPSGVGDRVLKLSETEAKVVRLEELKSCEISGVSATRYLAFPPLSVCVCMYLSHLVQVRTMHRHWHSLSNTTWRNRPSPRRRREVGRDIRPARSDHRDGRSLPLHRSGVYATLWQGTCLRDGIVFGNSARIGGAQGGGIYTTTTRN